MSAFHGGAWICGCLVCLTNLIFLDQGKAFLSADLLLYLQSLVVAVKTELLMLSREMWGLGLSSALTCFASAFVWLKRGQQHEKCHTHFVSLYLLSPPTVKVFLPVGCSDEGILEVSYCLLYLQANYCFQSDNCLDFVVWVFCWVFFFSWDFRKMAFFWLTQRC